ncbi:MAG: PilZ domain-containing protein [Candidatus Omnitrophota bacterium]
MQERRKFNRCKLEQKAKVSTEADREERGMLLDVSVGGMRIMLSKKVEVGSRLTGQFKIIPHLGPFYVQGIVAWIRAVKDQGAPYWEVGVKFNKVSTIPGQ